jgi:hypothetical protein
MPFCPKCGAEMGEDAVFCAKCGTRVQSAGGVTYRKDSAGWGAGRVVAIIGGGFLLIVALGFLAGGGMMLWGMGAVTGADGYMTMTPVRLNVASYAIVQDNIDVHMSTGWMINPSTKDIVSLKISVASNTAAPIFVGIATKQSAQNYLNGVNIDRLVSYTWAPNQMMDSGEPVFQTVSGGVPSSPPTAQSFWIAHASGTGTQTITWTPTTGEYWVVVMNADGTKPVDLDAQVGARVTILNWVGYGLLIAGLLLALLSVAAIYFGIFRRP